MSYELKVRRVWTYDHGRSVDHLALASESGDVLVCDHGGRLAFLDKAGRLIWEDNHGYAPLGAEVTDSGETVFILTTRGYLARVSRDMVVDWEFWVDKNPTALAIRSRGQTVAVGSLKARIHIINSVGKRLRLMHTPEPVVHLQFSSRDGGLVAASVRGWVGLYNAKYNATGQFDLDQGVAEMEVTRMGRKIFLPAREEGLHVIEVNNSQLATYDPGFSVCNVGINSKGDMIVAVGLDGSVALMDSDGKKLWYTKTGYSWENCKMNAKGDRFILTSDKGNVACYEVGDGQREDGANAKSYFDYLEI